ncbi:unnamed protein product [Clavelina lepadiformis]|uniref:G-protein coupled receptors family 1 profile domain-containing protein n=1 Tax=Clavelina lepadiformis TaxID=159417 RepID=A0ABP0EUS7_CLALP
MATETPPVNHTSHWFPDSTTPSLSAFVEQTTNFVQAGTSPATYHEQIVMTTVIAIFGIWSTFGNLVTILAIALHRGMRTKCNLFILSLALSDLISGVVASPLWLYRRTWGFYNWGWGDFLCKLYWGADETTSYCTALHIASFAVLRLIGVKWPLRFEAIKRRTVVILNSILWLTALTFGGFVYTYFYEVAEKGGQDVSSCWPMCSIRISNNGVSQLRIYYTFSSTTFLLLPMFILFVSSVLLVKELYFQKIVKSENRRKKERHAAYQLALISTSFLIGYVPMTSYMLWTTRSTKKQSFGCGFDYWFNVGAYFALRFSECLNPVMYNLASTKMRESSKNVVTTLLTCGKVKKKLRITSKSQERSKSQGSKDHLTVPMNDVTDSFNTRHNGTPKK